MLGAFLALAIIIIHEVLNNGQILGTSYAWIQRKTADGHGFD
jgi:hypothetical protein